MVFSSFTFLAFFLPGLLLLYLFCPAKWRNGLLLLASILFYSWGAPRFIFVILGTTAADFYLVRYMAASEGTQRKWRLALSVSLNLGLLFYFKYYNFFIANVNAALATAGLQEFATATILLPIGISFYTFESITYSVDVYRKIHQPLTSFMKYQLYILFFPKLIAGPIVRYHQIADQINDRSINEHAAFRLHGLWRFALGLAKKVLIANPMAVYANDAFQTPDQSVNTAVAWVGMLAYTFQIYFDFSGYSDMAIGLARLFGFRLPENFDSPYSSRSITEFWRRWHITLGEWMRSYLYIPLGGNRKGKTRTYINLLFVFVASGLWHGASWTFVCWGLYHGLFLIAERSRWQKILSGGGHLFSVLFTFLIVSMGWILFRADGMGQALVFYKALFSFTAGGLRFPPDLHIWCCTLLAVLFSFGGSVTIGRQLTDKLYGSGPDFGLLRLAVSVLLIYFCTASIVAGELNPFIYFRF